MTANNTRFLNAVSREELERRWSAVREGMRQTSLDALVVQNSSDWVGGHIRWFSNEPATNGYPSTLVFAAAGSMTRIEQGPFDGSRETRGEERATTGVTRVRTTPSYPSVHYSGNYDADIAVEELRLAGAMRVGLVAPSAMYYSFGRRLVEALPGVEFEDASDMVDRLKARKSPEEQALIRQVAAMQDEVMRRVAEFVRPGLRDFEIAAYAQYVGQQLGSEQGIFLCSSAPAGRTAAFQPRSRQGRRLEPGDVFSLLVENNGAGGFYTELSRIFVLGKASPELRSAHGRVLDAQRYALTLLTPGAPCREIYSRHNAYLRDQGLAEERRLSIHGMGYDMVERPLIRDDEDMALTEDMVIVVHPGILNETMFVHNTEVYLTNVRGPPQCLHATPRELIELG
jgi:Xaa-Pro aminopeptidase